MNEKEENNDLTNQSEEIVNFIPLIIFEKYIEIIDNGIELLNNFNNRVIYHKNNFSFFIIIYRLEY
jgi:hypothetical protein